LSLVRDIMSGLGLARRGRVIAGAHPSDDNGWWGGALRGTSAAGVEVDEWLALGLSTFWCCVSSISADIAKLPVHLYMRAEDDGGYRERVRDHPAADLMSLEPNEESTAFTLRESLIRDALVWGGGFAEVERTRAGDPLKLWWLKPWRMGLRRLTSGLLVYEYVDDDGRTKRLAPEDVVHVRGLGDSLRGWSVVRFARETIGGVYAVEQYGRRFFGNGGHPSAVLEHPGKLGEAALKHLRESFEEIHNGPDKAHRLAVLEQGMKLSKWSVPPEDGQFLQSRQFNVAEICRWFRFPVHKAGDLSRATFSNIEQQSLDYLGDCLHPWMVRVEQEFSRKLLRPDERRAMYFEHLASALLRTDLKTRSEAYDKAIKGGWMSPDEVRAAENRPPIADGKGNIFLVPVNMTTPATLKAQEEKVLAGEDEPADPAAPAPKPADPAADPSDPPQDAQRARLLTAACEGQHEVVAAALRRLARTLGDKAKRAAKDEASWSEFGGVLADQVPAQRELLPAVEAALDVGARLVPGGCTTPAVGLAGALARAWCDRSVELAGALAAADAGEVAGWERSRPDAEAGELVRALARTVVGAWSPQEVDRG
jgi:HK97 family phage portal protein